MARDTSFTPAWRGFARSPKQFPARIGCSRISSRWASDARTAPRRALRGRAARRPRIPHLARRLPVRLRVVRARGDPIDRVHRDLLVNVADWVVLLGTIVGIAAYGSWRTRQVRSLNTYLRGNAATGWGTIGLSVVAAPAGAVCVKNYCGPPRALIIVCALFLPMYRRLNVYTAYEFLGQRFDKKTRLL